ncbi:MAG TPA: hypothetical protein VLJ37_02160 [bacterium]|nr:hypothetical protein [bacterium]
MTVLEQGGAIRAGAPVQEAVAQLRREPIKILLNLSSGQSARLSLYRFHRVVEAVCHTSRESVAPFSEIADLIFSGVRLNDPGQEIRSYFDRLAERLEQGGSVLNGLGTGRSWSELHAAVVCLESAHRQKERFIRSRLLCAAALSFQEAGFPEWSRSVLDEAVHNARISGKSGRAKALAGVAEALDQAGRHKESSEILEEAIAEHAHRLSWDCEFLVSIAVSLSHRGRRKKALELFEVLIPLARSASKSRWSSDHLARLALSISKAGFRKRADELFQEVVGEQKGGVESQYVGICLAMAGLRDEARRIFEGAIGNLTADPYSRACDLRTLAVSLRAAQFTVWARKTFKEAFQTAQRIPDESRRSQVLNWIAQSMVQAGFEKDTEWMRERLALPFKTRR